MTINLEKATSNLLDRGSSADETIQELIKFWAYDLNSRRPGPAILHGGEVQPTDLDMACLLATLAARKAVVILPKYLSSDSSDAASSQTTKTQQVLSTDNRRGQLLRLASNEDYFSFSMLVQDMNVLDTATGQLGAPRYFHILGKDGRFHPGWESIQFVADAAENAFIKQYGLDVDSEVAFKQFVAPNRWTAFYGPYYFMTKLAVSRLVDEAKILRAEIKANKAQYEQKKDVSYTEFEKDESGKSFKTKTVTVPVFKAEVDAPWIGDLESPRILSSIAYNQVKERLRMIERDYLPELRFVARVTEYAFYKANGKAGGPELAGMPATVRKASWQNHKIARTMWRALDMKSVMAMEDCVLRYRTTVKDIEVAAR